MAFFSDYVPNTTLLFALISTFLFTHCFSFVAMAGEHEKTDYDLSLTFVPEEGRVIGTSKITINSGEKLTLSCLGLEITGSLLREDSGKENSLQPVQTTITLPPATSRRTLYLSYTKTVQNDYDNLISQAGISLTGNWYPVPEQPRRFHVTATLPDHFSAVMEADSFPFRQSGNTVSAVFSQPLTNIHFNAGPYVMAKQQVREGLLVYTMFFAEDKELADGYLSAAANYLKRYEKEIGPYPYNHYIIVANRLPTGYGMPTFTLLGQAVLRLPFIKNTSLGHEIVHSWFGNAVQVNSSKGNWCEGLTSYLADHAYREEKGEGPADRLESITRYLSYVHSDSAIPLDAFTFAGHNQPMAEVKRAVGYERGALFFTELRERIGNHAFQAGVRRFFADNRGRQASWTDVQESFAAAAKTDLHGFFLERLQRTYIPDLAVENIHIDYSGSKTILSFSLLQQTVQPFSLMVPVRVETLSSSTTVFREISAKKNFISIPLDQRPLAFTIDPDYTFLRQVSAEELPAVWSRFLGAEKPLVILGKESDRERYRPLIDRLAGEASTVVLATAVTNRQLAEHDLLFLGLNQAPSRSLFGLPHHPEKGFMLDVRHNPLNRHHVSVLVFSSGQDQTAAVAGRLSHYGKYSYLEFDDGHIVKKTIQPTSSGLRFVLEELPAGGKTSTLSSFVQTIDTFAKARVVYVGETHTSMADHLLQLRIIEALHKKNPQLAIGMEMFPASSQEALDRYTLDDAEIDERTFLKQSNYYKVWQFDYRLFRDILRFARRNHLPVIGLNLNRQIVSEVFRTGGTDSLEKEVRDALPIDRKLDMPGYAERLSFMHNMHQQGSHGSGTEAGFLQAQGIWDETMAENITDFLKKNPAYQMVVLAGSQHTRKDSGIPPRVARRLPVQQASVLNIYGEDAPANLEQVADYYFLAEPAELPEAPIMGIILDPVTRDGHPMQKISQLSPKGKAAAAGLMADDILVEVNGYPVAEIADVRIAMFGMKAGEKVEVKVMRTKNDKEQELAFQVELTAPPTVEPHP